MKQPTVPNQGESTGWSNSAAASTKMVTSDSPVLTTEVSDNPMQYLLSDLDEIRQVRVQDMGSQPHCAKVNVQGVPVNGVVDSQADITIMGGDLFKPVATVAKLRKKDFKPPDKVPRNYDQQPFRLDGRLDLDVSFQDKTMTTPVYVKMNAKEQLTSS